MPMPCFYPPTLQTFNTAPMPSPACASPNPNNRKVVYRWLSGSAAAGTLTATTCPYTGDMVLAVYSSPNPLGGPWTCVG